MPRWICLAAGLSLAGGVGATPPEVVVSIKPIHSLVASVMAGIASPTLLVDGYASPHTSQLKPSQMSSLSRADLVVWVGEPLEAFLARSLSAAAPGARHLNVLGIEGLGLLRSRAGGVWRSNAQPLTDAGADLDPHVWLDPDNAKLIVAEVVSALSALDPEHRVGYERNGEESARRIDAMTAELRDLLSGVSGRGFIVYHDAYQYFEVRFGLRAMGSISVHAGRSPSAKRLTELRAALEAQQAHCVFSEPQFESPLVEVLLKGTPARKAVLDPLGIGLRTGPDAYVSMMLANARAIASCLSP